MSRLSRRARVECVACVHISFSVTLSNTRKIWQTLQQTQVHDSISNFSRSQAIYIHNSRGKSRFVFQSSGSAWSENSSSFVNIEILRAIRPTSKMLCLSNESLGKSLWFPRKDYDSNRLISGELQVSNGTMLLVDQTTLREGKIHGTAVANLRALQDLVTQQTIPVDFKFYNTTLPVDVPVISVCTTNSMLKDFCVPLRSQRQQVPSEQPVRLRFKIFKLLGECTMEKRFGCRGEWYFICFRQGLSEARKRGIKLEQSDAHRWLTTATLLAKSTVLRVISLEQKVDSDGYGSTLDLDSFSVLLLLFSCCIFLYIYSNIYPFVRTTLTWFSSRCDS